MTASVLVAGGAGYIGSHMLKKLARAGYALTTVDNLSVGHRDAVLHGDFVHADLLDRDALARLFATRRFDLVIHFAASAYVGESVHDPRKYYTNNVMGTLNLVHAMLDAGVSQLIFSSTCASYGIAHEVPITESHPQAPINPYGQTKLVIEGVLRDYAAAYGLRTERGFFLLAMMVATVQGGAQALSRSLFAALIPRDRSAELFGFFSVFDKVSGILGPAVFAWMSARTGSSRHAVLRSRLNGSSVVASSTPST